MKEIFVSYIGPAFLVVLFVAWCFSFVFLVFDAFGLLPCSWGCHKGEPFCKECGACVVSFCPSCGNVVNGDNFCQECGAALN